jgi:peptide/nickel transport system permease protein
MLQYILWRIAGDDPDAARHFSALVFTIIDLPRGRLFRELSRRTARAGRRRPISAEIEELRRNTASTSRRSCAISTGSPACCRAISAIPSSISCRSRVVGDRLWLTILVSFVTIIFTWLIAFPIGIYSATHQYSWGDYGLTFLGLIGIAIPNFMLALILMYFANIWFGTSIGHLMDQQYLWPSR